MEKECECCGKLTTNPRFCSRSCAAKVTNKEVTKRKTTRKCQHCDLLVKSCKHTLCSMHFDEWKLRFRQESTLGEYRNMTSVKGKHPSWANAHVRGFARSWLKHLSQLGCAKCGYTKHVELAHIQPISSFTDDVKLSVVNGEQNVIQLCRNCHWEFDNEERSGLFSSILERLGKIPYRE